MKGTKRLGTSDSNSGTHDSIFQSKRMMVGTQFDLHRAEPSQQQSVEAPPLDKRQAESSRQHVRALNTQFASWVQTQLQNHPDELWEDGVQDYLTHASNIMEKFSEVVNWLKANSAKAENLSALGSQTSQKKLFPESKDNNVNSFLDKPGIPPAGPTAGFVPSRGNPMQNKFVSESKDNEIKTFSEKPEIAPTVMSGGFGTSWAAPVPNKLFSESKDNEIKSFSKTSGVAPAATSSVFGTAWAPPVPKKLDTENKDNEIKSFSKTPGIAPAGISPAFGMASGPVPQKLDTENKDNEIKTFSEKPGITPAGSTTGFAMPWSSGPVFSGQTSFSFGSQSSISASHAVSNDGDGEDDVEQPSSPSVKKTEEKGVIVVHEMKCKLYVKSSDPADKDAWKDKGTGQLYIKCKEGVGKGTKESKPTILVRNDAGRVVLNALLYPGIKTNMQKNSIVAIFHTSDDDDNVVARTFLIRAKTEEDRNKLASIIQEYAPAA